MPAYLLFDSSCPACSRVGRAVADLSTDQLQARSFSDPQIGEMLASAGIAMPDEPVLLVQGADSSVQVLRGLSMRLHLARLLGWREARNLVRLAWIEQQARIERSGVSRRKLLGSGVLGAIGLGVLVRAPASTAAATTSTPQVRPLHPDRSAAILDLPQVRRAEAFRGPISPSNMHKFRDGPDSVLVMAHGANYDQLSLIEYPPSSKSMVYGVKQVGTRLRMLDPENRPMFDIEYSRGRFDVVSIPDVQPDSTFFCVLDCMAEYGVSKDYCADACLYCATASSTTEMAIECGICGGCAGMAALRCVKRCRK